MQNKLERYGTDIFKSHGYDVEIWDFMPIVYPHFKIDDDENELCTYDKYRAFKILNDFKTAIDSLECECFVIIFLPYCISALPIYRILTQKELPYAVFVVNSLPTYDSSKNGKSIIYKIMRKLVKANFSNIRDYLFRKISYKYFGVNPATMSIMGGERSEEVLKVYFPIDTTTKRIWAHTMDYDEMLIYNYDKPNKGFTTGNIAVFIDDDMPYHSDYKLLNVKPSVSSEKYYNSIVKFFDYLEKELDVKIIIAGHPRSDYSNRLGCFGGREIIKYRTFELVRNSIFSITHASTAINFVVSLNKPLVLLTTDELINSDMKVLIDSFSFALEKRTINVDKNYDNNTIKEEISVNEQIYRRYKNLYIKKTDSSEKRLWEIVIDSFTK